MGLAAHTLGPGGDIRGTGEAGVFPFQSRCGGEKKEGSAERRRTGRRMT